MGRKKGIKPEHLKPYSFTSENQPDHNGIPKGYVYANKRLLRILNAIQKKKNPVTGNDEPFNIAEQMDLAQIAKALKGDTRAYKEIMDRLEGTPPNKIEHSANEDSPMQFIIKTSPETKSDLDKI